MPPAGLARLQPGQVLWTDARLGCRILVGPRGAGRGGRPTITLSEVGTIHRLDSVYDQGSGMLVGVDLAQQVGLATTRHAVTLVSLEQEPIPAGRTTMRWSWLAAGILVTWGALAGACGGGSDPGSPQDVPAGTSLLGTWVGEYQHPEGVRELTLRVLTQQGTYFTGTWVSSNGPAGDVSGTLSGDQLTFVADYANGFCSGLFDGTGTVSETPGGLRLDMVWSGTDCGEPVHDVPTWLVRVAGPT